MTSTKYIGMDVHKESISIAVMNASGKTKLRDSEANSDAMPRAAKSACQAPGRTNAGAGKYCVDHADLPRDRPEQRDGAAGLSGLAQKPLACVRSG